MKPEREVGASLHTDPSRNGLKQTFIITSSFACPGDNAVWTDQRGAQVQPVPRLAGHVIHPPIPMARDRLKWRAWGEVEQQSLPAAQAHARRGALREGEIGDAATD